MPDGDESIHPIGESLVDLSAIVGKDQPLETPQARDLRDIEQEITYWETLLGPILDLEEHLDDTSQDQRESSEARIHLKHLRQQRDSLIQEGDTPG